MLCGVQTPTEIESALADGADLINLFPAALLGPDCLAAISAASPQAPIVPTGGIDSGNAGSWIAARAIALGVVGALSGNSDEFEQIKRALAGREVPGCAGGSP